MSKTAEEIRRELDAKIPREAIAEREGGGRSKLSYLEGWYVINRLNQVLGQGNWDYETEEMKLVHSGTVQDSYGKDAHTVHYVAKVRLTAYGLRTSTRDSDYVCSVSFSDYGYGDGSDKKNPGKAHELAVKEAVTDGLKRCAKNLGLSMGLALYDKTQENVDDGNDSKDASEGSERNAPKPKSAPARAAISARSVGAAAAKDLAPVQAEVSDSPKAEEAQDRGTVNDLISSLANKIITAAGDRDAQSKKLKEVKDLMKGKYGTASKEQLTDEQAAELCKTLKGMAYEK